MYQIDKDANRISPLQQKRFSELGLREREHLQEWLAVNPEVLSEDLLIIQKEFDGFDETRERLDLLALDKQGHLVIIENKLDDSGRDVVWQALKYASYCAGLTKSQIVAIYQQYLDKYESGQGAQQRLSEFFDDAEFDELTLNPGSDQRIIFVAANFRREVTSTALWLMEHRIRIQCIKAAPYALGEQLFLSLDQIIPVKEAEEYMVGINDKREEQQTAQRSQAGAKKYRKEFWQLYLEAMQASSCNLYDRVSATTDHWLNAATGLSGVRYAVLFCKDFMRVEFAISRGEREENKAIFDALMRKQGVVEQRFGEPLEWERLEDRKSSRVKIESPVDGYNPDNWPLIAEWLCEMVARMEKAFSPEVPGLRELLRQQEPA